MNSKTKGNISEAVILAFLLKLGYSISIPLFLIFNFINFFNC